MAGLLAGLAALPAPVAGATTGTTTTGTTRLVGLERPSAIAVAAGKLWIANAGDSSVVVTSATGHRLQRLAGRRYGFGQPDAIAASGDHVFVLSRTGAITELAASDGSLVRVIHGSRYALHGSTALVVAGDDIWVADSAGNAISEISARDGTLVRVIRSGSGASRLDDPVALTVAGRSLWVVSHAGWLSRISLASGAVVRRIEASADGFSAPAGIGYDGSHLWVSNSASDTVTELTASGSLTRVITNSSGNANYGFDAPSQVLSHGRYVYVVSPASSSPMVTKIDNRNGDGLWFECDTNSPDPRFANPSGMVILGHHIWVVSPGPAIAGNGALANSLAELRLSTGQQIATFH